jgi:hypothetical protein
MRNVIQKDVMGLDRIEITWDDVEKIKDVATKSNLVAFTELPFFEGTLYIKSGKDKKDFAIYFNVFSLEFAMYIPSISTIIPSMEFKINPREKDLVFWGDNQKYWNKNKKGKEMMLTYYFWVIATLTYLLDSSLTKHKVDIGIVQKL